MVITVIGTGALGGYYGALLQRAGHAVHFVLRSDYAEARRNGIRVLSPRGDFVLPHVDAHNSPDSLPPSDAVLVGLKTTANGILKDYLPRVLKSDGVVITLQNGLGNEAHIERLVGTGRVLGGLAFLCARKAGPAVIEHQDYGSVTLGEFGPNPTTEPSALSLRWAEIFSAAGIETRAVANLEKARWRKLLWNIPFNGLSVVLNANTREIMNRAEGRAAALALMQEVLQVANVLGHDFQGSLIDKLMEDTQTMIAYDPSMRLDFLAGRPLEWEAIYAAPLSVAEKAGVDMPAVRLLMRQLQFLRPLM